MLYKLTVPQVNQTTFVIIPYVQHKTFEGENFHKLVKIRSSLRKLLLFATPKDAMPPNFAEKTFANSHKPQNLRQFSPSKLSRYTVLYVYGWHTVSITCTMKFVEFLLTSPPPSHTCTHQTLKLLRTSQTMLFYYAISLPLFLSQAFPILPQDSVSLHKLPTSFDSNGKLPSPCQERTSAISFTLGT